MRGLVRGLRSGSRLRALRGRDGCGRGGTRDLVARSLEWPAHEMGAATESRRSLRGHRVDHHLRRSPPDPRGGQGHDGLGSSGSRPARPGRIGHPGGGAELGIGEEGQTGCLVKSQHAIIHR